MTSEESGRMMFIPATTSSIEVDVAALAVTYSATLFKVAHAVLRDPDESKDVVQDVFLKVLRYQARLHEIADLRIWLVRIAWNLALDRRKRKKGDQMDAVFVEQLVGTEPSAQTVLEDSQRVQRVLRAIDRLPKAERQALLLATVNEIGTAEIGRIMERTESAVRGLIHRARVRLQSEREAG